MTIRSRMARSARLVSDSSARSRRVRLLRVHDHRLPPRRRRRRARRQSLRQHRRRRHRRRRRRRRAAHATARPRHWSTRSASTSASCFATFITTPPLATASWTRPGATDTSIAAVGRWRTAPDSAWSRRSVPRSGSGHTAAPRSISRRRTRRCAPELPASATTARRRPRRCLRSRRRRHRPCLRPRIRRRHPLRPTTRGRGATRRPCARTP